MDKPKSLSVEDAFKERPKKSETRVPDVIKLKDLSQETQEVLEYFGVEAPELLNNYAMALEDALIELTEKYKALKTKYNDLQSQNAKRL